MPSSPTSLIIIELASLYGTELDALTWTPADPDNGNSYRATGREILLLRHAGEESDPSAGFTVYGVEDPYGRTEDLNEELNPGDYAAKMLGVIGWRDPTTRLVLLQAESADVEIAVVRLPNGA